MFRVGFLIWLSLLLTLFLAVYFSLVTVSVFASFIGACAAFSKDHANAFPKNPRMNLPVIFFTLLFCTQPVRVCQPTWIRLFISWKEPHSYQSWKEPSLVISPNIYFSGPRYFVSPRSLLQIGTYFVEKPTDITAHLFHYVYQIVIAALKLGN